jgi:hypothetical protein
MNESAPTPRHVDDAESLVVLPYTQRQLIVVEPIRRDPPATDAGTDQAVGRAARAVGALGDAASRARNRLRERRGARKAKAQDLRPVHVNLEAAAAWLRFPPGHPHEGFVYVADPVLPGVYYPAADFHRKVFERKFADAVHLLMGLGATDIEVVYREGGGRDFAGKLDVATLLHRARSDTEKTAERASEILFFAHLDANDPVVPEGLAWLDHEPSWQGVVNGRMDFRLRDFALTVSYRDSFRVDSDFEGKIRAVGFEAGGKIETFKSTSRRVRKYRPEFR